MKKIIASILSSSMMLTALSGIASAESRTSLINKELAKEDEIHILYNDRMVQYEDVKPVNNEDRIMIPFRAALENMGATVDYDDSQRLVTSTKGDVTIHFTLLDDTIYINNKGEESTITMDVPMIIVQDRTLVPIRFMSNALGMQVGWDGDTQTVVIMDYDSYFDGFDEKIVNLNKLSDVRNKDYNKGEIGFDLGLSSMNKDSQGKFIAMSLEGNFAKKDQDTNVKGTMSIDTQDLSIQDAEIDSTYRDGKLFIKTNAIKKLAQDSDNSEILSLSKTSGKETWYSIDLKTVIESLKSSDSIEKAVFESVLNNTAVDLKQTLQKKMSKENDAVFEEVMQLAMTLDIYEYLDDYINITTNENGTYTISISLQPEDFVNLMSYVEGIQLTEAERTQILQTIYYTFDVYIAYDGKEENLNIYLDMISSGEEANEVLFRLSKVSTANNSVSINSSIKDVKDITNILVSFLPTND